jgi:hypothetical protein
LEEAQDSLKKAKPKAKAKDDAEEQKEQAEA